MAPYANIRLERQGARAVLSLARPEVRNALDEATLDELHDAFKRLGSGGERVVILKGEGKDFCAGADVRWMRRASEFTPAESRKDAMRLVRALKAVEECPCPV
ncbi:MAG: enoyl-CoA hydratase-related protein, partial [Elusimicrobiota bacterium]